MRTNVENKDVLYLNLLDNFKKNTNNKDSFLEIISFINENGIYFDSKLLIDLFSFIPLNERIKKWEVFLKQCTVDKIFDLYDIKIIVNSFNDINDKISFLSLVIDSRFFPSVFITDVIELLNLFDDKKTIILDLLIDNKKIKNFMLYQIKDFFLLLPYSDRKDMIYYLRRKIPQQFDDVCLLWVLHLLEPDEIVVVFNDLVINDINFNEKVLFENLDIEDDVNLTFYLLDLYISDRNIRYNDNKKKELFEKVKRYIADFGDFFCEKYPSGDIIYNEINKFICQEYGLNKANFEKFIKRFGYDVFQFLDCINIRKLINLDGDKFKNVLDLFDDKNTSLDQHTLNNVLNAFYQREFLLERSKEYMVFQEFELLIKKTDEVEILKKVKMIAEKVNIEKLLMEYEMNFNDFINKLLNNDKTAKDILHKITNKYLMVCRKEFVNKKLDKAHLELNLVEVVEKNSAKKHFFHDNSLDKIIMLLSSIDKNRLTIEQVKLLNDSELLKKAILYKINPDSEEKENGFLKVLSNLDKMVNILWENDQLNLNSSDALKHVYYPEKVSNVDLLGILSELDIDLISKTLLNDIDLYRKLVDILSKYKILGWGKTFDKLISKIDLTVDASVVATLINYFYDINHELANSNNFGLTKIMAYANCYASSTNKYAYLFGQEDYRLLCANAGNYKAPAPKSKRLELAVSHLREMYEKEYVTVPSFKKEYILKNEKKISAVIGNSTNMVNLTIGERTDSCLRICGLFYELYKFVIKDENGFNICFYDENNMLISRVSGVRYGNTVFLNQLRNSLIADYKSKDLHELMILISNDLLKFTDNSDVPIDNVVISSQEALKHLESDNQYIGEDVFKEGLYNLPFNYDTDGYAYLLASREPGKFIDKKISKDLPKYKCYSDGVKIINDYEGANNRFIQFCLINQLLNGKGIDEVQIPNMIVKSCISSDKFIIVKTFDDEIITLKLDKYSDDRELEQEIKNLLIEFVGDDIKGVKK